MLFLRKIFCVQPYFFHNYSLVFFHQGRSWKIFSFWGVLVFNNYQFFFCVGILMDNTFQNCLWYGILRILELTFLQNDKFHFFSQGFNLKLSTCSGILFFTQSLKIFGRVKSRWIGKAKKCYYSSHVWMFKLIVLPSFTRFVFQSRSQSFNW